MTYKPTPESPKDLQTSLFEQDMAKLYQQSQMARAKKDLLSHKAQMILAGIGITFLALLGLRIIIWLYSTF